MATSVGSLGFDLRGYTQGLTKDMNKALRQVEGQMQRASRRMSSIGVKMSAALTVPLLAIGKASVDAFGKQEAAEKKLRAALSSTGQEVDKNFAKFKSLAGEIQQITTVGDEASIEYAALATNMGITAERLGEATKGAIGLSKAFGLDMTLATKAAAAALQGKTELLTRYIPTLSQIEDQGERVAFVQQKMAQGFAQAQAEAQTFQGGIQQMKNAVGDAFEAIGAQLAPALVNLAQHIKNAAIGFSSLSPELQRTIVGIAAIAAAIGPALLALSLLVKGVLAAKAALFVAFSPAVVAIMASIAAAALLIRRNLKEVEIGSLETAGAIGLIGNALNFLAPIIGSVSGIFQTMFNVVLAGFKFAEAGVHTFIATMHQMERAGYVVAQGISDAFWLMADNIREASNSIIDAAKIAFDARVASGLVKIPEGAVAPGINPIPARKRRSTFFGSRAGAHAGLAAESAAAAKAARAEANQIFGRVTSGESFFGTQGDITRDINSASNAVKGFGREIDAALEDAKVGLDGMKGTAGELNAVLGGAAGETTGSAGGGGGASGGGGRRGVVGALQSIADQSEETAFVVDQQFSALRGSIERNISDAAHGAFTTGKFSFAALGSALASSFLRDFSDNIAKGITSLFSGQGGFSFGSVFTSIFSGIFGGFYAEGGRPPMGRVSVVGEQGPEFFVPDAAGTIVPASAMAAAGSGGPSIIVNQHFQTGVSEAQLFAATREVERSTTEGIVEAMQRGGSFRKRMR